MKGATTLHQVTCGAAVLRCIVDNDVSRQRANHGAQIYSVPLLKIYMESLPEEEETPKPFSEIRTERGKGGGIVHLHHTQHS